MSFTISVMDTAVDENHGVESNKGNTAQVTLKPLTFYSFYNISFVFNAGIIRL